MKTRSNMPLFVVECEDVKALSNTQIDQLRCGDYLVKITNGQEHAYKVTYKKEGEGMCLTYVDASVVETVSYDWNNSTKKWVYNSTDVAPISPDAIEEQVIDLMEQGEPMSGYSWATGSIENVTKEEIYVGAVKNGNKLTIVWCGYLTRTDASASSGAVGTLTIPEDVGNKLIPSTIGSYDWLDVKIIGAFVNSISKVDAPFRTSKPTSTTLAIQCNVDNMVVNTKYFARYEATFLLSDNLAE